MSAFTYEKGDVIGFGVDMTDATAPVISVYKNGKLYHVTTISNPSSLDLVPFATFGSAGNITGQSVSGLAAGTFRTIPATIEYALPDGFDALEMSGPLEKTEYMSTRGFITEPTNFPANQLYPDAVLNIPVLRKALETTFTGGVIQSYGEVTIDNYDHTKDGWLDRSWNGREVSLLIGDPTWNLADYRELARGINHELVAPSFNTLALKIRDKSGELDRPIKLRKFFGDSFEYAQYIEGSEAEYETLYHAGVAEGQFIPICYGECYQIPAILVDAADLIYQVHDGPIQSVVAVYDKGLEVDFTPMLSEGKFRLHAQPVGTITADIYGAQFSGFDSQDKIVGDYFSWGDHHASLSVVNGTTSSPTSSVTNTILGHLRALSQIAHQSGQYAVVFEMTAMDSGSDVRIGITNGLVSSLVGAFGDSANEWALSGAGDKITEGTTSAGVIPALNQGDKVTLEIDLDLQQVYCRVNNGAATLVWTAAQLNLKTCFIGVSVSRGTNPTTVTADGSYTWYAYNFPYTRFWNELKIAGIRGAPRYHNDPTNIIYDILNTWSYLDRNWIDFDSLSAFYNNNLRPMGIWIDSPRSAADIISEITRSYLAFWGFNRQGKFELKNLEAPENAEVSNSVNINIDEVKAQGIRIKSRILPTNKIDIGYKKFYKTQTESELAGGVLDNAAPQPSEAGGTILWSISITPIAGGGSYFTFGTPDAESVPDYSREYRIETLPNRYVKIKHKLSAESEQLNTVLVRKSDATKLARARMDIFSQLRTVYTFDILKTGFGISIGDVILIDNPRFGFAGGKNALVVGIDESFDPPSTTLDVFV